MYLASALFLLAQTPASDLTAKLDELVKARNVEELSKYLAPYTGRNPLLPIKTGGAYETGRFGWRALLLRMLNESFVVFTTPLTSEDIGELLFRFDENGKLVYVPEDFTNGERIVSHDFTIGFDIPNKRANIKDTIELLVVGQRSFPPFVRIGPNYSVNKITDSQGRDVAFLQAGGIICFPSLRTDEKLTLNYTGDVNKPAYAGSISDKEAMLTNDYWYPMVARMPAPYKLTVTTPPGWVAVGQGERTSKKDGPGGTVTTFKMDLPVTYYSFSAAPYKTFEREVNGKVYRMWSNQLTQEQMELQTELYPPIIDFYERFAKFPFSGWGAVVSRVYGGGALEAYSFATYGGGLPGEDPHETAHTWWGGMVDNTYLKSMWNESFADFCQGYYQRNVPIGNVEERRKAFIETPSTPAAYKAAPISEGSPFIGPAASSLGYGKGALVLQMLEQELGSDRMLKSMQDWQKAQPKTRGGEWEDFEAAVDRIKGNDATWFFDQWVRRAGWVDFYIKDLKWAAGHLTGRIVFTGDPYIVHAEMLVRDESGKETTGTAELSSNARNQEQKFVIECRNKPNLVSFDPWRRLLRPIHADEQPVELESELQASYRYTDPKHLDYMKGVRAGHVIETEPKDMAGVFYVGHPDTLPVMKELCKKAGFVVDGNSLTWKGTTIDLTKGAALAVVDLGHGKRCMIGLGKTRVAPSFGRARTVLVDDLGRFLRGETEPKTSGFLTYRSF